MRHQLAQRKSRSREVDQEGGRTGTVLVVVGVDVSSKYVLSEVLMFRLRGHLGEKKKEKKEIHPKTNVNIWTIFWV